MLSVTRTRAAVTCAAESAAARCTARRCEYALAPQYTSAASTQERDHAADPPVRAARVLANDRYGDRRRVPRGDGRFALDGRRRGAASRPHPRERLRDRDLGRHDVADDHRSVADVHERVHHRRVGGSGDDQQGADLAKAGDETTPPIAPEQLLVVDRTGAGRHHEQLARLRHLLRDSRDRDPVHEAVHQTVRIVARHERLDGRRVAEQIADRDAAVHRLHARDAERRLGGRDRIRADDDDRVKRVERGADSATLLAPVHRARRAHGPPS